MATKADVFIELTKQDLIELQGHLEVAAALAQNVRNRWTSLGTTNMAGYSEYVWNGFTAAEWLAAMNCLLTDMTGVTLQTLNTAGPTDKIVKLCLT